MDCDAGLPVLPFTFGCTFRWCRCSQDTGVTWCSNTNGGLRGRSVQHIDPLNCLPASAPKGVSLYLYAGTDTIGVCMYLGAYRHGSVLTPSWRRPFICTPSNSKSISVMPTHWLVWVKDVARGVLKLFVLLVQKHVAVIFCNSWICHNSLTSHAMRHCFCVQYILA